MKWQKKLLLTLSGIISLFAFSFCLLDTIYDHRMWEEIIFLKPNGDEKPGIVLVLFFVLIAQMIQIYVHMGRFARKELSSLITVKIDRRKWLKEKNEEMYLRGFLLFTVSLALFILFNRRIPDIAFCLFDMYLILLLSQLTYSELFLSIILPDREIPVFITIIPAVLTITDATKNLGLIVYTGSSFFEGVRLVVSMLLWAGIDVVIYGKIKNADIF